MHCTAQEGGKQAAQFRDGKRLLSGNPSSFRFTIQTPKAKTPQFPRVKRTRKMPRRAHGFLPHGGEEAAEVEDACVQPSLRRGLVSVSTPWDGVWQLHNRQEIPDPRIHFGSSSSLTKASSVSLRIP